MIKYMLDTDICSYMMREKPIEVLRRLNGFEMEQFCISIITVWNPNDPSTGMNHPFVRL